MRWRQRCSRARAPIAVAALVLTVLAFMAAKRRWSAFVLGSSLAVFGLTLIPALFMPFSNLGLDLPSAPSGRLLSVRLCLRRRAGDPLRALSPLHARARPGGGDCAPDHLAGRFRLPPAFGRRPGLARLDGAAGVCAALVCFFLSPEADYDEGERLDRGLRGRPLRSSGRRRRSLSLDAGGERGQAPVLTPGLVKEIQKRCRSERSFWPIRRPATESPPWRPSTWSQPCRGTSPTRATTAPSSAGGTSGTSSPRAIFATVARYRPDWIVLDQGRSAEVGDEAEVEARLPGRPLQPLPDSASRPIPLGLLARSGRGVSHERRARPHPRQRSISSAYDQARDGGETHAHQQANRPAAPDHAVRGDVREAALGGRRLGLALRPARGRLPDQLRRRLRRLARSEGAAHRAGDARLQRRFPRLLPGRLLQHRDHAGAGAVQQGHGEAGRFICSS